MTLYFAVQFESSDPWDLGGSNYQDIAYGIAFAMGANQLAVIDEDTKTCIDEIPVNWDEIAESMWEGGWTSEDGEEMANEYLLYPLAVEKITRRIKALEERFDVSDNEER